MMMDLVFVASINDDSSLFVSLFLFHSPQSSSLLHARTLGFAMVHMHERKNSSLRCAPEISVCSFIHSSLHYSTLARTAHLGLQVRCAGFVSLRKRSALCSTTWRPESVRALRLVAHMPTPMPPEPVPYVWDRCRLFCFWKKRYSTPGARQIDGA